MGKRTNSDSDASEAKRARKQEVMFLDALPAKDGSFAGTTVEIKWRKYGWCRGKVKQPEGDGWRVDYGSKDGEVLHKLADKDFKKASSTAEGHEGSWRVPAEGAGGSRRGIGSPALGKTDADASTTPLSENPSGLGAGRSATPGPRSPRRAAAAVAAGAYTGKSPVKILEMNNQGAKKRQPGVEMNNQGGDEERKMRAALARDPFTKEMILGKGLLKLLPDDTEDGYWQVPTLPYYNCELRY